jgi:curved DNA-binding protein CbpA
VAIDLSTTQTGQIGKDAWFSDLYAAAVASRFTGGILVKIPKDAAVFFRKGVPVHAGGAGFEKDHLGEILVRGAHCAQSSVITALEKQAKMQARPLLGALLVADEGVSPDEVKNAVRLQTEGRVLALFALAGGPYQTAPGENARIRDIGVPGKGIEILVMGLRFHASDPEYRKASDELLGKAVQLEGTLESLGDIGLDDDEKSVVKYLDKPRKPDQLERALSRRMVRSVLRLLSLLGRLKTLPAAKAIPIPKATLLKGQVSFQTGLAARDGLASPVAVADETTTVEQDHPQPPSRSSSVEMALQQQKEQPAQKELIEEITVVHKNLAKRTHYDILAISPLANAQEVKRAFHALAKQYHPDAFTIPLTEEDQRIVREVSARVNEAYQVLSNDKTRVEYDGLVADDRVKGDSRKAELIRDAEVKHQMGVVMLRKRDFQKAREYFNFAMESDPDCGEYKSSLARAMYADPKFDRDEALRKGFDLLKEGLRQQDNQPAGHYYLALMLKAKGNKDDALFHFKRTLHFDPKHTEAQREVRLMEMRAQNEEDGKKGGLSKLFKR